MPGPAPPTGRRAGVSGARSSPSGCRMRASYGARVTLGRCRRRSRRRARDVRRSGAPPRPVAVRASSSAGAPGRGADDSGMRCRSLKIHRLIATNRTTVAARLATAIATVCSAAPGLAVTLPTSSSARLLIAQVSPKTVSACRCWRPQAAPPADAERPAPVGGRVGHGGHEQREQVRGLRRRQCAPRARRTGPGAGPCWPARRRRTATPGRARPAPAGCRPIRSRTAASGSRPEARARRSRTIPCRSSIAVRTTSTRLSGSSYQSTGTSWIRRPQRSASTSSSVSKNHAGSSHHRQQLGRDVRPDRLEPALGVGEPGAQAAPAGARCTPG